MPSINTAPQTLMNYLVPAVGNTHGAVVNGIFSATPFNIDWQQFSQANFKFVPQGLFADNTQGTADLVITIGPMNYNVVVKAGTFGQFQFPAPSVQTASIVGSGYASIVFVDFPVLPSSGIVNIGNSVDVVIAGINAGVTIPTSPTQSAQGLPYSVNQTPSGGAAMYGSISGAATSYTAAAPVNQNIRKLILGLSANATLAAAAQIVVTVTLNGTQIFKESPYVLAAVGNSEGMSYSRSINYDTTQFNSGAAGNLVVSISTALATGSLEVNALFD